MGMKSRMKAKSRPLLLLVALGLVLAACAPATGRQASQPVVVGAEPIAAEAGETLYVRVDYDHAAFDLKPGDLRPALWVPAGYASERGDVAPYFGLRDLNVGQGWKVTLSRMMVERKSVSNISGSSTTTEHSLWAEVKVEIPEDAIAGQYRVRGTLQARGGRAQTLQFRLDVRR